MALKRSPLLPIALRLLLLYTPFFAAMMNLSTLILFEIVCLLGSCQQPHANADQAVQNTPFAAASAPTVAAAQTMVLRHLQGQPQVDLYQLDSMRLLEVDGHWQVLVPRTDWVGRMPNAAAFKVDKQTGQVTSIPVK
jgi:hypothetical protein